MPEANPLLVVLAMNFLCWAPICGVILLFAPLIYFFGIIPFYILLFLLALSLTKGSVRLLVIAVSILYLLYLIFGYFTNYDLVVDYGGGVDDVIATLLQLLSRPKHMKAIAILPADSFLLPDAWVVNKLLQIFHPGHSIPVGWTDREGTNTFPTDWRNESYVIARLPFWHDEKSLLETDLSTTPSAVSVIIKALEKSRDKGTDIIVTGPLINIAGVFTDRPELKKKIRRLFITGGAVNVSGNVKVEGRDATAEWNVFSDARSFNQVLHSGVDITLVPLDATNHVPITPAFRKTVQDLRSKSQQFRLVDDFLASTETSAHRTAPTPAPAPASGPSGPSAEGTSFFRSTLTSLAALDPSVVQTRQMAIRVELQGPSEGRTVRVNSTLDGWDKSVFVDVAVSADPRRFEAVFLAVMNLGPRYYRVKEKTFG